MDRCMKETVKRKDNLMKDNRKKHYNKRKQKEERATEIKEKEKKIMISVRNRQQNRTLNGQKCKYRVVWMTWREMNKA